MSDRNKITSFESDSDQACGKNMKPKRKRVISESSESRSSDSDLESVILKKRKKKKKQLSDTDNDDRATPELMQGSKNEPGGTSSATNDSTSCLDTTQAGIQDTSNHCNYSSDNAPTTLVNGKNKMLASSKKGKLPSARKVSYSDSEPSSSATKSKENNGSDSDSYDETVRISRRKRSAGSKKDNRIKADDSDSSNESIKIKCRNRKRNVKVVNDTEISSDEEINQNLRNRKKKSVKKRVLKMNDSFEESSSSDESFKDSDDGSTSDSSGTDSSVSESEDQDNGNEGGAVALPATEKSIAAADSSDSGDETCEKCAICLRSITSQEVGSPEGCDHLFCSVCLIEWSKNSNVCPLDRQQFSLILVRKDKSGTVVRQLPVEEPRPAENILLDEEATFCEICGASDREDRMLLCDGCDRGFHTECLTPPLEEVPAENEWFCPACSLDATSPLADEVDIYDNELNELIEDAGAPPPNVDFRLLRPLPNRRVGFRIRTRLLERIRITVNQIVRNYIDGDEDDEEEEDEEDFTTEESDSQFSMSSSQASEESEVASEAESAASESQPGTSGTQSRKESVAKAKTTRKRKRTTKKRRTTTRKRKTTKRKKRKTTTKRKTTGKSLTTRKTTSKSTKKTKSTSKTTTTTKKVKSTRRRKTKVGRKKTRRVKTSRRSARARRARQLEKPKGVKARLAKQLGMVRPKNAGQLLPDVKIKPNETRMSGIALNRARAGIPTLHIFGPRDELQYYSSGSDHEEFVSNESGGLATMSHPRTSLASRSRDRKKAALALQSSSAVHRPKPVIENPAPESVDILGSILHSQTLWHSKNTKVKVGHDGKVEAVKDKPDSVVPENSKVIDVRGPTSEGVTTQAPMYPGSGSNQGGYRPYRSTYGGQRGNQGNNSFSERGSTGQGGMNFNRFGGPPRNDREGYANYLNNIPQGPTPFCRGGPPLRFRMPSRPQLRRAAFPGMSSRLNRSVWQQEEEEEDGEGVEGQEQEKTNESQQQEEDVDLYSDIEASAERAESSGPEDTAPSYPALGPPPEPPAFLLGLDDNGEPSDLSDISKPPEVEDKEDKDKSEVYDPAEPCDSDDELVIDEQAKVAAATEAEPEPETSTQPLALVSNYSSPSASPTNSPSAEVGADTQPHPETQSLRASLEDDDDDCPIFSIYSSASREFSQKEEEVREREIAEDRRKLEEMKSKDNQKEEPEIDIELPADEGYVDNADSVRKEAEKKKEKMKEKLGTRLSFAFDDKIDEKSPSQGDDSSRSPSVDSGKERSRSGSRSPKNDGDKSPSPEYDDGPDPVAASTARSDRSLSSESDKSGKSKSRSPTNLDKSSPTVTPKVSRRTSQAIDSEVSEEGELEKDDKEVDEEDEADEEIQIAVRKEQLDEGALEKAADSESESTAPKHATGLEGLDVEEVSSDNGDGNDFADKRSLSSLSLSDLSNRSRRSRSPVLLKKKKKKKKKIRDKPGKNYEEGEIEDGDKDKRSVEAEGDKHEIEEVGNENTPKTQADKARKRKSRSAGSDRPVLSSKENKKPTKDKKDKERDREKDRDRDRDRNRDRDRERDRDRDLSWKKPSKKDRNYREGKKRSKDRARSRSKDRRKSRSASPRKDKKKGRDRRKKSDKKKDIERYDVRKIVQNKDSRKTDAFGRDILSKSRSATRSRTRSPVRDRSRNMLRRDSRSFSRSRSRSFRRARSPVRRRFLRSRSRSRSKSVRRSFSRSRSRSNRKTKKKIRSKERLKGRSRSRGRLSRSVSRGRRRTISRSRSPMPRLLRNKKQRPRRSWSHHISRSPSFSPRRSRSITRSPVRVRRSFSRSVSRSWSRNRSPFPRATSLEKLTVVLTTKDKKKGKKKKEGKKSRKDEERRKKTGNSKEVFASGDNVLVSVNFRNNNNTNSNNNSGNNNSNVENEGNITSRLESLSPLPAIETGKKKRRGSEYESERVAKKKKSNAISKNAVDAALSNACPKRAKKLTRLSEKDAEVILNRKPVAVIDLDMSPYREQTPSPINVVVVSDSGSGDEGKEQTPQRQNVRESPGSELEKSQEKAGVQSATVSAPSSPVTNGYMMTTSGPKTPPEPQIKFSISKPQQLRQIANPLGDDDEEAEEEEEEEEEEQNQEQRIESLDRRIEKELDSRSEVSHKGPNTPPGPRGPTTPKTPPSPQTSPDAYDPFEPTKSRSPSPSREDRPISEMDQKEEQPTNTSGDAAALATASAAEADKTTKTTADATAENLEDKTVAENVEKGEVIPVLESCSAVIPVQPSSAAVTEIAINESPERKITVVITTPQNKTQPPAIQKVYTPVLKQLPMATSAGTATSTSVNLTVSSGVFSLPSPTKTSRTITTTTQSLQMTGIQRLQHRLGSPVNRTPNSIKSTPEKRSTPRTNETNEIFTSGNYLIRNVSKRNGEQQPKQPRPLQDATNETVDMDDSPYSPASSEGDDLFEPPVESTKPPPPNLKPAPVYKPPPKTLHKSPMKALSKFDLLFGPSGPTLSPVKLGSKKNKANAKAAIPPKIVGQKGQKKNSSKRGVSLKMDEDQLRILDELPSSAVELQVKDKFLKKLNRQERVVDEVKTVLKPHYARKHITKEEYKDILRRSVPKICHSRSGEINPSKIQSLIEAYVRKFRHAKKKGGNTVQKPKIKKTMFS